MTSLTDEQLALCNSDMSEEQLKALRFVVNDIIVHGRGQNDENSATEIESTQESRIFRLVVVLRYYKISPVKQFYKKRT